MKAESIYTLPFEEIYRLMEAQIHRGGEAIVRVRGNSMAPFVRDLRDQAVFASLEGRTIHRGDIVLYQRRGGQFVMHRVYDVANDGTLTMVGDAQWTLEEGIAPAQLRAFVPRVVRKGRTVSCERGLWHALMKAYLLRIRFPRLTQLALRMVALPRRVYRKLRGR